MFHRIAIVVAVAVLLCGCSGGEGVADGDAAENASSGASGSVEAPDDSGLADEPAEPEGEEVDTVAVSGSGMEPVDSVAEDVPADDDAEPPLETVAEERESDAEEPAYEDTRTSHLRVLRAYVCKGIEQSEPTEAGKSFVPEDGVLRLCCFSEVAGASGPDTVHHVWRWGEREMARVELEVKSSRWRTWSTKRILDEWQGEWHVDVTDADGVVLASLEFSVE